MWTCTSLPYLSPRAAGQPDAWSEEAARAGRSGTQRIIEVTETRPPQEVADELNLAADATAVVRRRLISLDGDPIEIAESWYPASIASGTPLAEPRKIKGGAVTLLAEMGYTAHESREDISVRPATASEAEELELPPETQVIVLARTALTAAEVPFEVSLMTMIAEGRHLRYVLRAN